MRADRDKKVPVIQANHALQQISSWMTAILFTLNSSKTEFLLIGVKNQFANITYLTPPTRTSLRATSAADTGFSVAGGAYSALLVGG